MSDSKSSSGGVGFAGLLTIAFVVLKLCKVIDWSWWWIVSPMLISIGAALLVLGSIGVYYFFIAYKEKKALARRNKERDAVLQQIQDIASELSENINKPDPKSKWQQRLEQMQEQQKSRIK